MLYNRDYGLYIRTTVTTAGLTITEIHACTQANECIKGGLLILEISCGDMSGVNINTIAIILKKSWGDIEIILCTLVRT